MRRDWVLALAVGGLTCGLVWVAAPWGNPGLWAGLVLAAFAVEQGLRHWFWSRSNLTQDEAARLWVDQGRRQERELKEISALLDTLPTLGHSAPVGNLERIQRLVEAHRHREDERRFQGDQDGKVQKVLASVNPLADLLRSHLGQSLEITESAALGIMTKLKEVVATTTKLVESLESSQTKAKARYAEAHVMIADTQVLVEGMNGYQRQRDRQIQEDGEAIKSIVRQINELKSMTALIRNFTEETNVLAVNATIEAARAGRAGAGFAVVAKEVKKLATEAGTATDLIEKSITDISRTVNEKLLAIVAQIRIEDEERWLSSLAATLPRLSKDIQLTVTELDGLAQDTKGSVEAVRGAIYEALGHSQFQDITRQQIEQVQKGLRLMGQHGASVARAVNTRAGLPRDFDTFDVVATELLNSYTMSKQHVVHQKTLGADSKQENTRPLIELF